MSQRHAAAVIPRMGIRASKASFVGAALPVVLLFSGCSDESSGGACDEVDCGPYGQCVESGDQPTCACETGYHPDGLTCVADNRSPVITNLPASVDATALQAAAFQLTAQDPDPGDTLTWTLSGNGCSFAPAVDGRTGLVSWVCGAGLEACDVEAVVTDDGLPPASDTGVLTIRCLTDEPAFVTTPPDTAVEHQAYVYAASCRKAGGGTLTIAMGTGDTCNGALQASQTGDATYIFTPDESMGGSTCVVDLTCSDGQREDQQSAAVTVAEDNAPPAITNLPDTASALWGRGGSFQATATDDDIPPNTLTFSLVNHTCSFLPQVDVAGLVTWTCGSPETCEAVVRVTDDGSPSQFADGTLTIQCTNQPPSIDSTPPGTAVVGVPYHYDIVCSDGDGDALTITSGAGDTCGGTVTDNGNGTAAYDFTPVGATPCMLEIVCSDSVDNILQAVNMSVATTFGELHAGGWAACLHRADGTLGCWGNNGTGQADAPAGMFTNVDMGGSTVCGVRADQTLECWGYNNNGQADPPAGSYVQVSTYGQFSCAVDTGGSLTCWGNNIQGTTSPPAGTFVMVSAGVGHACAVTSANAAVCWGRDDFGETTPPAGTFSSVSAASSYTCGLRTNGMVACWGINTTTSLAPPPGIFVKVEASNWHACAMNASGQLTCWGNNQYGQTDVPAGMTFVDFALDDTYSCGLTDIGGIVCWGGGDGAGRVPPNGTYTTMDCGSFHCCGVTGAGELICWGPDNGVPTPPAGNYVDVGCGGGHTCGLLVGGSTNCFGSSNYGQTGPGGNNLTTISAYSNHNCGLTTADTVNCWGWNSEGQAFDAPGTFIAVDAGYLHTCAVTTTGAAQCWGYDADGRATPPGGTFVAITAGSSHSCGILDNGSAVCWGSNAYGKSAPPADAFIEIDAAYEHTCGVTTGGDVLCWGDNSNGQSSPPTGYGPYVSVDTGTGHTCALTTAGHQVCWGRYIRYPL